MSDREKRAMAAEQRAQAAKGSADKCSMCSTPLTRVPFERLTYKCTFRQRHLALCGSSSIRFVVSVCRLHHCLPAATQGGP